MASGSIKNTRLRVTSYSFSNLAQYNPGTYYLTIPNIRSKMNIPNDAIIISATLYGWANLGQNAVIGMSGENAFYILYTAGTSINTGSYVNVRVVYQI